MSLIKRFQFVGFIIFLLQRFDELLLRFYQFSRNPVTIVHIKITGIDIIFQIKCIKKHRDFQQRCFIYNRRIIGNQNIRHKEKIIELRLLRTVHDSICILGIDIKTLVQIRMHLDKQHGIRVQLVENSIHRKAPHRIIGISFAASTKSRCKQQNTLSAERRMSKKKLPANTFAVIGIKKEIGTRNTERIHIHGGNTKCLRITSRHLG